jgi:hypothetical protein
MTTLKTDEISELLDRFDVMDNMQSPRAFDPLKANQFESEFAIIAMRLKDPKSSVLGIDILGYSQYAFEKQALVPLLFSKLLNETIRHILQSEIFMFQGQTRESILERFIPTGDGGFIVFENPLQGLLFSMKFASMLHLFNSYSYYPGLRHILGEIRVRYCHTYDILFQYENNYYGPAIINNHRVMSRDKLDRCLMDREAYDWFLRQINGIESLQIFNIRELSMKLVRPLPPVDPTKQEILSSILKNPDNPQFIRTLLTQKIGEIKAKTQSIDVYNLFAQFSASYSDEKTRVHDNYIVNLGNLNASGLSETHNGS